MDRSRQNLQKKLKWWWIRRLGAPFGLDFQANKCGERSTKQVQRGMFQMPPHFFEGLRNFKELIVVVPAMVEVNKVEKLVEHVPKKEQKLEHMQGSCGLMSLSIAKMSQ